MSHLDHAGPSAQFDSRRSPPRLIAAYLDPENGHLTCGFADARKFELPIRRLGLPPGPPVVYASVDELGAGIDFIREDGSRTDCGADYVLFLVDPGDRVAGRSPAVSDQALAQPVGRRLAKLRRRSALSQRDLALRVDMAGSNYARIEAGRYVPSTVALLGLASALGCTLGEIVGPEPGRYP